MAPKFLLLALLALSCSLVLADPNPLQDFCVADPDSPVILNGFACKMSKDVEADDFFIGNDGSGNGLSGLNTLSIDMVTIILEPGGLVTPHIHPRSSEMVTVANGTIEVGFVTTAQNGNRLFLKVLKEGDQFVIPKSLTHFQRNVGHETSVAFVGFNSQSPGTIFLANTLFGSNPSIPTEILAKTFNVTGSVINKLRENF